MLDSRQQEHIGRFTRTLQIIIGALALGVAGFAMVVLWLQPERAAVAGRHINSLIASSMAVVALMASMIVPRVIGASMRRAIAAGKPLGQNIPAPVATELGDVGALTAVYQTTRIVAAAILDAAACYNLVAYMLEQQSINLVFAAALLVAILGKFPTRGTVEYWLNNELKQIEELRMFGK